MQLLHTQPIVGSSPTITTKFPRIVKWYNGRLISDYRKFNSFSEDQFMLGVSVAVTLQTLTLSSLVRSQYPLPINGVADVVVA